MKKKKSRFPPSPPIQINRVIMYVLTRITVRYTITISKTVILTVTNSRL